MKSLRSVFPVLSILFAFLLFTASCSENASKVISEEEAVELIQYSLQYNKGGLNFSTTYNFQEMEARMATPAYTCNVELGISDWLDFVSNSPHLITYYDIISNQKIICDDMDSPTSFWINTNLTGYYQSDRINSNDVVTANLAGTGFEESSEVYRMTGSFSRRGSQTFTFSENNRNITSELNINFSELHIKKGNYTITSGEGTITLTGTDNNGGTFALEGSIVFDGSGIGTIFFGDNDYRIYLN